jgi:hypothetical protein
VAWDESLYKLNAHDKEIVSFDIAAMDTYATKLATMRHQLRMWKRHATTEIYREEADSD